MRDKLISTSKVSEEIKFLNVDNILERVSEYSIFSRYVGTPFKLGVPFLSPLRDEQNPSFNVFVTKTGKLLFKDFSTGESGNCFAFVQLKYRCSFYQALEIINRDFQLGLLSKNSSPIVSSGTLLSSLIPAITKPEDYLKEQKKMSIGVVTQPFTEIDIRYWKQYDIDAKMLQNYDVFSIQTVYNVDTKDIVFGYLETSPIYGYLVNGRWKIYRPFATQGKGKWLSNLETHDIFGFQWIQVLIQKASANNIKYNDLIITKSLKDVMVFARLGYPAIAPQSESCVTYLTEDIVKSLYNTFSKISIIYDGDRAGWTYARKLVQSNPFLIHKPLESNYCLTNCHDGPKDIADYYKTLGKEQTKKIIDELIEIPF